MKFYPATHPDDYYRLDTSALRDRFLIENIRPPAGASLSYVHDDRAIAGGVTVASELPEHLIKESDSAAWRDREIGIFNLGYNPGRVRFNGESFELGPEDALYLGMGAAELILESCVGEAFFFIGAAPAHRNLPTRRILKNETEGIALGSSESANERVIRKYICPGITESCQLTMGITSLEAGSIWNTMPCHLHHRRMEIYCYYGLPENGVVFHQMGRPDELRTLAVRNYQAVISPPWSVHFGAGTSNYKFLWMMLGENRDLADVQPVPMEKLR